MTKKFDNSINEVFGLFGKKQPQAPKQAPQQTQSNQQSNQQPQAPKQAPQQTQSNQQSNQQPQDPKSLADVLADNVKFCMDRGMFDKEWGSKVLETIKLLQYSLR